MNWMKRMFLAFLDYADADRECAEREKAELWAYRAAINEQREYERQLRRELNKRVPWHQRDASGLVSAVTLTLFGATVFVLTFIISGH